MSQEKSSLFKIDFDSYILQSEPTQQKNEKLWQTAIEKLKKGGIIIRKNGAKGGHWEFL